MPEVTDFWTWLMAWAPTIWYVTAFAAFWVGSGAFVFRSLLRAMYSYGWQRIAAEASNSVDPAYDGSDRVVWAFSSVWVLILAAFLGPLGSLPFALVYGYFFTTRHSPFGPDHTPAHRSPGPRNVATSGRIRADSG